MTQITKIINLTTTSKLAILSFALTFFYLIYLLWFLLHSNETPTTNNKRFGKGEKILLSTPSNRSNNINNNNIIEFGEPSIYAFGGGGIYLDDSNPILTKILLKDDILLSLFAKSNA